MASTLLYRACALVVVGIVAGAVHSGVVPVKLHPDAPAPDSLANTQTSRQGGRRNSPSTNTPEKPTSSSSARACRAVDEMAGLNITLAQAKSLYDAHVPFVDARHMEDYETGQCVQDAFQMSTERTSMARTS